MIVSQSEALADLAWELLADGTASPPFGIYVHEIDHDTRKLLSVAAVQHNVWSTNMSL